MHRAVGRGPFRAARHLREAEPRDPASVDRSWSRCDTTAVLPGGHRARQRRRRGRSPAPRTRTSRRSARRPCSSRRGPVPPRQRLATGEQRLITDEAPDVAETLRRKPRPTSAAARARRPRIARGRVSEATSAGAPARSAVSVTPTISQCQSNAAAAAHAANAPSPPQRRTLTPRADSAASEQERRAPRGADEPDHAQLCERLQVEGVGVAHDEEVSGRRWYQRYSNVPEPFPTSGRSRPAVHATRNCDAPPVAGDAEESVVEVRHRRRPALNRVLELGRAPQPGPRRRAGPRRATSTARACERDVEATRARRRHDATGNVARRMRATQATAVATQTTTAKRWPSRRGRRGARPPS